MKKTIYLFILFVICFSLAAGAFSETSGAGNGDFSSGSRYNEGSDIKESEEKKDNTGVIVTLIVLPPLAAFIAMLIRSRKMKTAVKQNYASEYINSGSFNLSVSRDMFLYSTITKTERPKPNSSSR